MSTTALKRRAIATMQQAQPGRMVHSSSVNQATALSTPILANVEAEEIVLAPIFDIFDAPSRLSESSEFIRERYTNSRASSSSSSSPIASTSRIERAVPEMSVFGAHPSRQLPTSLPAPIIFDGPARPQNATLAMRSRTRQSGMGPLPPPPRPHRPASARSFSSSEPLVQMFDGPAKITRYHHQPSGQKQKSSTYLAALGVAAGAVGCAALAQEKDEPSRS